MQTSKIKRLLKAANHLNKILFLGLLLIGLEVFAQTDGTEATDAKAPANPTDNQDKNQIVEDHDTKNLDKLLINYNKDQEKVLKDADKIKQNGETNELSNKELGAAVNADSENNPAMTKADLSLFDLHKNKFDPKKTKLSDTLKLTLGPIQKMSDRELLNLINEAAKDSPVKDFLDRFPKLSILAVNVIKDKQALPSASKILDDQDRMIYFSGIMVCTVIFGIFLKKFMKKDGRSIGSSVGHWFLRFCIINGLRFGIFYYFFNTELTPLYKVVSKTLF